MKQNIHIGINDSTEAIRARNDAETRSIEDRLNSSKIYPAGAHELTRTLIDQNNIIIRQNEEIIRYLKALYVTSMK